MNKMRICMFATGLTPILPHPIGAIEPYVYGIAKKISERHFVEVFGIGTGNELTQNLNIRTFPYSENFPQRLSKILGGRLGYYLPFNLYMLQKIISLKSKKSIDIIHIHDIHSGPIVEATKMVFGIPYVCSIHNEIQTVLPIQSCDKILAVSNYIRNFLIHKKHINSKKIEVVNIAVNCEFYKPQLETIEAKKLLGYETYNLLLFVGRKCPEKGPQILIDSLPEILKIFPKTIAVMIGPDSFIDSNNTFSQHLKRHAKKLGVEKNIVFEGFASNEYLRLLYNAADMLIFPSIWQEPFGKVILEAMCYEKPVVASNVGGVPEIIKNNINGLLVPPSNPSKLATAVNQLLANTEFSQELGKSGREIILRNFTFEKVARHFEKIYENFMV